MRFEITAEQALAAPIVVTPFTLYDCAPQSDGAAALLLAGEDVVDDYTNRPVWIRGVGLGQDSVIHQHRADLTSFPATIRAARQAYTMAGLAPSDISVAEVHDFFTGIELISYEDLGFADRFGAYKLVEAEVTSVGGTLPVNPSGGLKSKGPPPGATGVAQTNQVEQPFWVIGVVVVRLEQAQDFERPQAGVHPALLQHHADQRAHAGTVGPRV